VHKIICMCYVRVVMRLKQSNTAIIHVVDLLALSEHHINKHLIGIQAQATGHCWCESATAGCVFLGTHYSVYIVTLNVFLFALSHHFDCFVKVACK